MNIFSSLYLSSRVITCHLWEQRKSCIICYLYRFCLFCSNHHAVVQENNHLEILNSLHPWFNSVIVHCKTVPKTSRTLCFEKFVPICCNRRLLKNNSWNTLWQAEVIYPLKNFFRFAPLLSVGQHGCICFLWFTNTSYTFSIEWTLSAAKLSGIARLFRLPPSDTSIHQWTQYEKEN